jgi:HEAT repeat protein
MMKRSFATPVVLALLVASATDASITQAQSLANRIASSSARSVQFTYPARPGVCGDGKTYISTSPGNFYGSYSSMSSEQCAAGPVRVVADVADHNVIALRTFVGGEADAGVTNLGSVAGVEAVDYLLNVAARADGRVGRDAIFAASLADKVDLTPKLLDIARDQNRPLETRRAALSGLSRAEPAQLDRVGSALVQIATNEGDVRSVRSSALSVLARLDHGAGITPLIQLANGNISSWIGRESLTVLARSGDPRARQFLRTTIQRNDLADDVQAAAIRGLGREYVTGQDANLLRSLFPRLTGQASRSAVLSSIAELGGTDNIQWLMGIVRDDKQPTETRRRALEYLTRAGATPAALVGLYDATTDTDLRQSLINAYSRLDDKAATDKLIWIARNDQNLTLRRRAVSALSRNNDPAIRQVMADIIER